MFEEAVLERGSQADDSAYQVADAIHMLAAEEALREKELERQQQAKKSPFQHWYQVNKDQAKYLRSCLSENPRALQILLFLFENMDGYNAVVCSYSVLCEACGGVSRQTATKAVKYLKDHGFIYVYKSGTSNVYVANKNLVWNSYGSNAKYCKFPASVVLSYSEQNPNTDVEKETLRKVVKK